MNMTGAGIPACRYVLKETHLHTVFTTGFGTLIPLTCLRSSHGQVKDYVARTTTPGHSVCPIPRLSPLAQPEVVYALLCPGPSDSFEL